MFVAVSGCKYTMFIFIFPRKITLNLIKNFKPFGNEGIRNKKNMKIVLIGYMGSGKSSVGQQLATQIQYGFKDLDSVIEASEGTSIASIFSEKGEIYFRKKENEVLQRLLSSSQNEVIATGGGTPCYGTVMEMVNTNPDCVTVYLKGSIPVLTQRLFLEKDQRPLIAHLETEDLLNDFIRKHLFERSYYYSQSKLTVSIDNASIDEIVNSIIEKLF